LSHLPILYLLANLSNKGGAVQGEHWWELRACDYYTEFEKPTIRYQEMATYQCFAYTREPFYSNAKTYIIPTDDLSLLAALNSKVVWWCLKNSLGKLQGGTNEMHAGDIERTPMPIGYKKELGALVEKILSAKDEAEIKPLENAMDSLVETAFGLTKDEIALIHEGN
jgi:hypothetical protein